jgi:hypothetical protein
MMSKGIVQAQIHWDFKIQKSRTSLKTSFNSDWEIMSLERCPDNRGQNVHWSLSLVSLIETCPPVKEVSSEAGFTVVSFALCCMSGPVMRLYFCKADNWYHPKIDCICAFQLHGHLYTLYFFSLFWGHVFSLRLFSIIWGHSVAVSCWS